MHRIDNSKFLLFIEPKKEEKLQNPVKDELTELMKYALGRAKTGTSNYSNLGANPFFSIGSGFKGTHVTSCGQRSSNVDFLLENGMITNSLAVYYLEYYRNSIPDSEMKKVLELKNFYK